MIHETIPIQVEGSRPDARLVTYILDDSKEIGIHTRPVIVMCPGGAYHFTSDREGEALAMRFLAMGYHVVILRYSCKPAVFPAALLELASVMKLLHENADKWHIDTDRIIIQGASAGGHLAASLGVFWNTKWLAEKSGVTNEWLKPFAQILCYPVITSGEFAHPGSFEALLAGQDTKEMRELVSIEKQVNADTPQTFLWHTYPDQTVPMENALLFVGAMRKANIPVEFHLYSVGGHGLSTCDEIIAAPDGYGVQKECQSWLPLLKTWLDRIVQEEVR